MMYLQIRNYSNLNKKILKSQVIYAIANLILLFFTISDKIKFNCYSYFDIAYAIPIFSLMI